MAAGACVQKGLPLVDAVDDQAQCIEERNVVVASMQAWIIDASEMDAEDILSFRSNLLHPNPEIRSFLKPDNKGTTIVIAPKGFGKTLLLKAKRLSIQDKYTHILPSGALVEKPSGLPSVIPTSDYGDLRDSEGYWRSVWLLSFTIAVLKATDYEPAGAAGR